jgi:hypothetical protein
VCDWCLYTECDFIFEWKVGMVEMRGLTKLASGKRIKQAFIRKAPGSVPGATGRTETFCTNLELSKQFE